MAFLFEEEKDIESWMRPFTSRVRMPDYSRRLHTDTRLFWLHYWHLLDLGYSEGQLSDYALQWRWYYTQPYELALSQSVLHLGHKHAVERPAIFPGYPEHLYPRDEETV